MRRRYRLVIGGLIAVACALAIITVLGNRTDPRFVGRWRMVTSPAPTGDRSLILLRDGTAQLQIGSTTVTSMTWAVAGNELRLWTWAPRPLTRLGEVASDRFHRLTGIGRCRPFKSFNIHKVTPDRIDFRVQPGFELYLIRQPQ